MTDKTELEVTQADREADTSWFLFAVRKGGRDVVILDYAPGWEPHNIEFHWEDTFQDDPPNYLAPGSYLWTDFTVGYWGEDDHIKVTGGNFAALTAATRTPDPTPVVPDDGLVERMAQAISPKLQPLFAPAMADNIARELAEAAALAAYRGEA